MNDRSRDVTVPQNAGLEPNDVRNAHEEFSKFDMENNGQWFIIINNSLQTFLWDYEYQYTHTPCKDSEHHTQRCVIIIRLINRAFLQSHSQDKVFPHHWG